jgi:hypothetical protein
VTEGRNLSRREQAIVRLLETQNDGLPEPVRASTVAPGFVHTARSRTCPDCLANGEVSIHCETCHGSGVVEGKRFANIAAPDALPDDGVKRDPYARNDVKAYGLDGARHDDAHARDRMIEIMQRQTRPARSEAELLEEANRHPYGWERERAAMRKRFDYDALDKAMAELRVFDEQAYGALYRVFVYRWLPFEGAAAAACRRGLRFLSPRLAVFELAVGYFSRDGIRPLRAPDVPPPPVNFAARGRGADPLALAQRDAGILAAIDAGETKDDVARRFGLSISQLNRILAKAAVGDAWPSACAAMAECSARRCTRPSPTTSTSKTDSRTDFLGRAARARH